MLKIPVFPALVPYCRDSQVPASHSLSQPSTPAGVEWPLKIIPSPWIYPKTDNCSALRNTEVTWSNPSSPPCSPLTDACIPERDQAGTEWAQHRSITVTGFWILLPPSKAPYSVSRKPGLFQKHAGVGAWSRFSGMRTLTKARREEESRPLCDLARTFHIWRNKQDNIDKFLVILFITKEHRCHPSHIALRIHIMRSYALYWGMLSCHCFPIQIFLNLRWGYVPINSL